MFVTVTTQEGVAESLNVEETTTVQNFVELSAPLFGLNDSTSILLLNSRPLDPNLTFSGAGVKDGDLLLLMERPQQRPVQNNNPSMGNLNFSSLLSGGGGSGGGGGGLNLIPNLQRSNSTAVQWSGMTLDDVFSNNVNPTHMVQIIRSHPQVWKELNHHNSKLAATLRDSDEAEAVKAMRNHILTGGARSFMGGYEQRRKDQEMEARLAQNPYDEEANRYFGEKINQQNIDEQYRTTMAEYPEAMGRVLMLYIDAEVNGRNCVAFVDSGAQSTIMSSACAERLDILRLVDKRFAGTAVGVGSGKILGRIHIANLTISGYHFPCSVTVMDSSEGLGDKNMDFLFGLDMLKRHRCIIDLARNCLVLSVNGNPVDAPFLHEHQLDMNKGGTRGYDPAVEEAQRAAEEAAINESLMEDSTNSNTPASAEEPPAKRQTSDHSSTEAPSTEASSNATETATASSSSFSSPPSTNPWATAPSQSSSQEGGLLNFSLDLGGLAQPQPPTEGSSLQQAIAALVAQGHDATTAAALALQQMVDRQQRK